MNGTLLQRHDAILLFGESEASAAPDDLAASVSAGPQVDLVWTDQARGNTNYSVERADQTAGDPLVEIGTSGGGDLTTFSDPGPFVAKHRYAYRVTVVGGPSDGQHSNQVAMLGANSHVGRIRRNRYV